MHVRRVFAGAVVAAVALAVAACGAQSSAGTFEPPAPSQVASASQAVPSPSPSPSAQAAGTVIAPPFGPDAKVVVDSYAGDASTAGAVVAAKDMLLSIEYAYYTGGKDTRWKSYTSSPDLVAFLTSEFTDPSTTSTSWTGTTLITHMSAVLGTDGKNTALVTYCEHDSGAKNASLATHQALPASQQTPASKDYYLVSYELSGGPSSWKVTQILPNAYYPRAPAACKP
jgi:hypothetical protein